MENFKKASKSKLRVQTSVGLLSTEQLWDLSITQLDELAVLLEEQLDKTTKKSFIKKTTEKSELSKLKFEIVLDILQTKVDEQEALKKAKETKEWNQSILERMKKNEEASLDKLSNEELEKLLK